MYRNDGTSQKGNCIELIGTEGVLNSLSWNLRLAVVLMMEKHFEFQIHVCQSSLIRSKAFVPSTGTPLFTDKGKVPLNFSVAL